MTTRSTLLTAATIVGAFAVGRMFASDAPTPTPMIAPQPGMAPAQAGLSSTEIRNAVRAELQRERPIIVTREEAVEEEPAPEVLEQRAKALTLARGVVNSAISAGRWTGADARALLATLPQLGPEEHDEIMSSLIRPVNAGHVKVETAGSLLDPS